MPPKKDESKITAADTLVGFDTRETKLLAAGYVSLIGPDKVSTVVTELCIADSVLVRLRGHGHAHGKHCGSAQEDVPAGQAQGN
jgi:hypothetical protein